MGTLGYTATISLDGYAADANGDFDWTAPGGDLFRFHVERMTSVSHEVLGRNTYQLMTYWETPPEDGSWSPDEHEFARRWQDLTRIAVSSTMTEADLVSDRDRLLPRLDLARFQQIVDDAEGEVEIFGPTTAAEAISAGMVDDFRFFIVPRVVGGGLRALPPGAELDLELVEHRAFENGAALLHYRRQEAGQGD
ncbi:dihydrofolate reductase family protein [Dietzia sp. SLG310A2-38A2]|uniref:dihydrofolate reductase family protein n=1 Tax=Dietzia sp. SLG310A2-38A2 TaxID=1630643 RepID=UPI0015F79276|nr:dihydrofolate reductase family protein [Dietzia sp. SLG310A2-38A2]MBB1030522.1 dihydrofolate reductase family protein [Dietzia sp. SLG310A2-38A2]